MDLALQTVAFLSVFAFCTYACIFADPDSSGVARLCTLTIPSLLSRSLERLLGKNRTPKLLKLFDQAMQYVYLVLLLGSYSILFAVEKPDYISSYHYVYGSVMTVLSMGSWNYVRHVGPGSVTAATTPLYDHYEYDNLLYTSRLCPTLQIRKVARSKYDRVSRRHVPRFDHYCSWIACAVGERNHRWFLLFVTIQTFLCGYGAWIAATVLHGKILKHDLFNATFVSAVTGVEVKADASIVFNYLIARNYSVFGVLILASVFGVMLVAFLTFHLYITSRNMTTNEFFKWRSVRKWHKREKKKYERALKDGKVGSTIGAGALTKMVPDGDVGCTGLVPDSSSPEVISGVIDPGPMPENIYDKGIINNFYEVLFPLSLREEAIQRYRAELQESSAKGSNKQNRPPGEKMLKPKAI